MDFWNKLQAAEPYIAARTRAVIFFFAGINGLLAHQLAVYFGGPKLENYLLGVALICATIAMAIRAGDKTPQNVKELSDQMEASKADTVQRGGNFASRGFIKIWLLVALAVFMLCISFAASAQVHPSDAARVDPPKVTATFDQTRFDQAHTGTLADVAPSDPVPTPAPTKPQIGGCFTPKLCIGPEVALTVAAVNLSSSKIEAAFAPGVGLGLTYGVPGTWKTVGVAGYLSIDPGANNLYLGSMLSFLNGYAKVGVSKGFLNDRSWRILIGPGLSL